MIFPRFYRKIHGSVKELLQIFPFGAYGLIICMILPLLSPKAFPCTVFWFQSQKINEFKQNSSREVFFGKNFDWFDGSYEVFRNPREKNRSESRIQSDKPFEWTSKYESITLNQRGDGHPVGGMNEKGLVVELLVYGKTKYEVPDERRVINEIAWAQYILDSAANVQDAINIMRIPRIEKFEAVLEYFICDLDECAVIQFENAQANIFRRENLEFPVLSNWSYTDSVRFTKLHTPFGGTRALSESQGNHPVERFMRAAVSLLDVKNFTDPVADSFKVLDGSKQQGLTQWQIVYNLSRRELFVRDLNGAMKKLTFEDKARR